MRMSNKVSCFFSFIRNVVLQNLFEKPYLEQHFAVGVENKHAAHAVVGHQKMAVAFVERDVYRLLKGVVCELLDCLSRCRHFRHYPRPPIHNH